VENGFANMDEVVSISAGNETNDLVVILVPHLKVTVHFSETCNSEYYKSVIASAIK
jgi:hypothetical protein